MEALQRTANRGSISTGPYQIDNSLKFEADNTEYLERDPASAGDRQKFTTSMWVKRTELGQASTIFGVYPTSSVGDTTVMQFGFMSDDKFQLGLQTYYVFNTNRLFRDTSAWYHIVVAFDTTQSTAANRIKLYVNGTQETSFAVETYPNQNHSTGVNFTEPHRIGTLISNSWYFSGYIAEVNHVDGSQLAPTDFGEVDSDTGIWIPKKFTGSYGTNGFYLDFKDSANLGNDASGGLDFTETNITAADQATDSPTNSFATGNNLAVFSNPSTLVLTEGQTKIAKTANGWETLASTIAVTSGKWYMEFQNITMPESAMASVFPADIAFIGAGGQVNNYAGKVSGDGGVSYYSYGGTKYVSGATAASYGASWANETNTMAIALDMDNGKVYFARANTWQNSGDPTSGATGTGAIDLPLPNEPHMMGYGIYANNTSGAVNFGGYTLSSISSAASDARV